MGTTGLNLPTEFDESLKTRDRDYWATSTTMVVKPKAEGAEGVRALVEHLAPQYGVAPELARVVAETESNFNPRALSRAGAQGVMQLMPDTAKRYAVSDPWNPEDNIRGGLKYLAKLQQLFPGRVDLQLAAYNAGEGAVQKYGNTIPPYPETQAYVQKIQGKLAGIGGAPIDPGMVQAAMSTPATAPPHEAEWTASRRPFEAPLEEPLGQRLGPRLATGALGAIESGLKGVEPLEKSLGVSTGLGALATATAQDLHEYVTAKIAPTGTEHTALDTTAEALGQALPFFVPGMATESVLGHMASVAPKIATAVGYTTAGVLQGITAAGGTYDALSPLVGEEEAAKRASHAFATNTLLGTVGSALGIFNRSVPEGLSRVVMGAVSQGVQGGIAYDLNRGEFWVDANAPNADALKGQGWEQEGSRVVQPYRFKNQLEAAVVQSVVGGAFSGMQELSKLPLPASLQAQAHEPGFTAQRAVEAALMPGMPPSDVPPATWQRWGQAILDLLPEVGHGGLVRQILKSERGSLRMFRESGMAARAFPQSKVRDTDGNLLRVFHGAAEAFETFDPARVSTGDAGDFAGLGPNFTESSQVASTYARERNTGGAPNVRAVYLDIRHPIDLGEQAGRGDIIRHGTQVPTEQLTAMADYLAAHVIPGRYGRTRTGPDWLAMLTAEQGGDATEIHQGLRDEEIAEPLIANAFKAAGYDGATVVEDTTATGARVEPHRVWIPFSLDQVHPATTLEAQASSATGGAGRGLLGNEVGAVGGRGAGFSLQQGAEGLTPERYRTEAGQWRIPLRDMPSQELELQDFIRQQGKINLSRETDVPGELRALIAPAEVGREMSLQNDRTGVSLQEMASRAAEQGFIASADKESLLQGLDRTINAGQNVYSQHATGHVPLLDSPHVEAAYRHTLGAIQTLEARTVEQTRGVRPHAEVFAEAQAMLENGGWTIDDVREILPGTALDDTTLGQVMLSISKVGEQLQTAAQRVVETGGHPGSSEVMDYLTVKAMFAEVLPQRAGVAAEAGRTLSFLNEPVSAYNRYLQELHAVTAKQGEQSVLNMARMDLAVATPHERLAAEAVTQAKVANEAQRWQQVNTAMEDWWAGYQGEMVERPPLLDAPEDLAREAQHRREDAEDIRLRRSLNEFLDRNALTPYQGDLREVRLLLSAEEAALAERRAGAPARWEQFFQEHGVEFKSRLDPGATPDNQRLLLNPTDYPQVPNDRTLALAQANLAIARPGFAAMMVEQYTAAKLGPRSWIKNAIGNTAMGIYAFPVRLLAEGISPLRQGVEGLLGQEPTAGVMPGETAAMWWGLTHGTRQHFINAAENWQTGESHFGSQGTGKTDVYPQAVTGENVAALGVPIDPNGPTAKVIDFWAQYVGWLSLGRTTHKILNSTDEFYKSWNASIQTAALAHAEAARLGVDGQPVVDQVATIMADPTLAARIDQGALDYAIQQTLQQQLPDKGIGSWFTGLANYSVGIPGTAQELPVGRLLLPFVKIPVNGARFVIDNSILALAQQKTYATIAKGGREADIALSQIVMGSLAMAGAAALVGSMSAVGRAPSDPVQRDIFLKEHPEYSVKIAGRWVPVDYFEPIANTLKLVFDVAQLMGELKGEAAGKIAAALFFGVNKNLWGQTAAKSLTDFFDAMQPGRGDESADQILNNLERYARQQVPQAAASWATTAAVRALDPETKAIRSMIDGLYAQFPWGSTQVPRQRSLNGEPELYGAGVGPDMVRPLVRALVPGKWQDMDLSPADRAIKENDMQLRKAPALLDREAMPLPGEGAPKVEDVASLKGLPPTNLSPADHEVYQVLRALNETEARRVFAWKPGDPDIIPEQAVKLATQRVALSQAHESPPHETMSLGSMLDWLTTTKRFQEASGGRGGGKEAIFRVAVQQYGEMGKAVFLQLHPTLAEQHLQTEVLHKVHLRPLAEQGPRQLMEEGRLRGRAEMERHYLGFDTATGVRPAVGGNQP